MASVDTSMDYMSREEVMAIWNANINLTDEELLAMEEDEFRARVRERCHHTLEIQVYHAQHRDKKLSPTQADYAKRLTVFGKIFQNACDKHKPVIQEHLRGR